MKRVGSYVRHFLESCRTSIGKKCWDAKHPWVYCILELARKQGNKLIRIYRPFTQCPRLWGEARESFWKMGVLKQLYDIIYLGIHNQINRCVMISHIFERLHLGSRCISSQVGQNWFKSHDVAAASAFGLPKCWRFGYCLELTRWVPARKVLEFDHCIGSSGPLHWRGRLWDCRKWGCE